jgi:hypothetical protein
MASLIKDRADIDPDTSAPHVSRDSSCSKSRALAHDAARYATTGEGGGDGVVDASGITKLKGATRSTARPEIRILKAT